MDWDRVLAVRWPWVVGLLAIALLYMTGWLIYPLALVIALIPSVILTSGFVFILLHARRRNRLLDQQFAPRSERAD